VDPVEAVIAGNITSLDELSRHAPLVVSWLKNKLPLAHTDKNIKKTIHAVLGAPRFASNLEYFGLWEDFITDCKCQALEIGQEMKRYTRTRTRTCTRTRTRTRTQARTPARTPTPNPYTYCSSHPYSKVLRHTRALRFVGERGPAQHLRKAYEEKCCWRQSMGGRAVRSGGVHATSGLGLFFSTDQFLCFHTPSNALSETLNPKLSVVLCCVVLCCLVLPCRAVSCRVVSCPIVSCCIVSRQIIPLYLVLSYFAQSHLALSHLIASYRI
jgi:hypothetical protein